MWAKAPAKKKKVEKKSGTTEAFKKWFFYNVFKVSKVCIFIAAKELEDMTLDELDELEDEEEERILEQYKKARMAEIKAMQAKSRFGDVREISAEDYVNEVNKAGEGIFVVLHLYKQGIPLCALINQYLTTMAMKYPTVKFLRSISTTCIPNYPDHNLPTIFVYHEGEMKAQLAGPHNFRGMNMSADEFEFLIGKGPGIQGCHILLLILSFIQFFHRYFW